MTETTPTSPVMAEASVTAPAINNTSSIGEVKVETNYAPAERKSTELVTTEPTTDTKILDAIGANKEPVETKETPAPVEVTKPHDNEAARRILEAQIRAENAEKQLQALKPSDKVSETEPDISHQETWGEKYSKVENTLENFLKAHADWAREEGKRLERDSYKEAQLERQRNELRINLQTQVREMQTKHADFSQVFNPIVPIIDRIPVLQNFVATQPMGIAVAYELGKNPAVLEQLSRQNMWQAGETLLKMAARISQPKVIEQTNAPEPIKPVGSREVAKASLADLAAKDVNGYIHTMNKRELAKKRASYN